MPVGLDELRAESAKYGDAPYLLTVSDDGRAHAVSVRVSWEGDELNLPGGTRSRANARARPAVSLLWPALEEGGFGLIVDGSASVLGERIVIRPLSAVLHRTVGASGAVPEASECSPVLGPTAGRVGTG